MEKKSFHSNYDDNWIKETLLSIGFLLQDHGDHWRTSAVFRSGDNPTSIFIYKKTGVWKDFAEGGEALPLQSLISKTVGANECAKIFNGAKISISNVSLEHKEGFLKMEKIYPEAVLNRLLPHYDFYIKRKISVDVLQKLKCGYASGYEMYQRMVFPIFNRDGKIHGFSGRHVFWKEGETKPKWKHIGETKNWAYPLYAPEFPECEKSIIDTKTVYLVESIGDALAMIQCGIYNILVTFGISIKEKVLSEIFRLGVEHIYICFNKDERENGQLGACKSALNLLRHFIPENIHILVPIRNDVHTMLLFEDNIIGWSESTGITSESLFGFFQKMESKLPNKYKGLINKYERKRKLDSNEREPN